MSWAAGEKRGVSTSTEPSVQVLMVLAVLIHDGEALLALVLRPALRDVDDAGVEIAVLAGDALVDLVGDLVRDAAPIVGGGGVLEAGHLLAAEHVPEAGTAR